MRAQNLLTNSDIAELLAVAAESAKQPLQKALRRASRKAFLWPEEAAQIIQQDRSLDESASGLMQPYSHHNSQKTQHIVGNEIQRERPELALMPVRHIFIGKC